MIKIARWQKLQNNKNWKQNKNYKFIKFAKWQKLQIYKNCIKITKIIKITEL